MEEAAIMAARRKPPENMTAFDCMLRGLDHHRLGGVTDDNAREAVKWFSKAIEADPTYSDAYAWRICAGSWLSDYDFDKGRQDLNRALELDPRNAEANRIAGVFALMDGNFDEGLSRMRRAMELNPTDAYIKAKCAWVYNLAGEAEHSLRLLDEAEILDPFLPVYCVEERGVALYSLGRHAEAIESFGKLTFQTTRTRLYRAAALVALGRRDEAARLVRGALAGKPDLSVARFIRWETYRDADVSLKLGHLLAEAGLPA
jgi:tetratricopeptide (TPR) repeat protein